MTQSIISVHYPQCVVPSLLALDIHLGSILDYNQWGTKYTICQSCLLTNLMLNALQNGVQYSF